MSANDKLTRIEKLVVEWPDEPAVTRVKVAMILWDCDRHAAARKLGIGWRTAYRVRDRDE